LGGAAPSRSHEVQSRSAIAAVPSIGRAAHVERAAREADATQDLYERHSGQIFGFCVNKLGSRDEAEDALQSTFLNAHRALQRGVTPEAELAWLYKIAHNVCLTRRRSTRRRGRVESPSDFAAVQDVLPAPPQEAPEDLMRLTEALEHMPESQRRAILLREWQGLSYHEIADELNLSQSAVETLIFRARRTLASNLESETKQPGALSRMRKALDGGMLLAALKGLFEGGAAVKVAAVAVAASGTVVVATATPDHVSKSASQQAQAGTRAAPVIFERTRPTSSQPVAARDDVRSARPATSVSTLAVAAAELHAPARAAVHREKQRMKREPKATPPGRAKKQRPATHASGNAGKKKAKSKAAAVDRSPPAPVQTPPKPEQLVVPMATDAAQSNGQGDNGEKGNGPKK
jgi:RNA polymerase sigma factor (sigma-70 family)